MRKVAVPICPIPSARPESDDEPRPHPKEVHDLVIDWHTLTWDDAEHT